MRALRQRMAEGAEKKPATASEKAPNTSAHREISRTDIEGLRGRITARLGALPADERGSSRAARIFVESVLVWEFGDEVLHDPTFSDLLAQVQDSLTGDPELSRRFIALLNEL